MDPLFNSIGATPVAELTPLPDINLERSHLVEGAAGVALLGSRCARCGTACFPRRDVCLKCGSRDVSEEALAGKGTLYSFSTVHISSSRSVPYTIGYVDLVSDVRLLAVIDGEPGALQCDMPVRLRPTEAGFTFGAAPGEIR